MPLHLTYNGNRLQTDGLTLKQKRVWDDWYLPSRDELVYIKTNLNNQGIGDFNFGSYWSSSETRFNEAFVLSSGSGAGQFKSNTYRIRPTRKFISSTETYSIGDRGPAGGWIFYIQGTTYYESGPYDLTIRTWSNITNTLIGTTSYEIDSGLQNSLDIINQPGHTDSAAKLCLDFVYLYG